MCKAEKCAEVKGSKSLDSGLWPWKWKGNGKRASLWRKTKWDFPAEDSMRIFPGLLVSSVEWSF